MEKRIREIIKQSCAVKESLAAEQALSIAKAAAAIVGSLRSGGKLIVFGNGGSAADSQHMVAEFVGRFKKERKGLPAIALTTNTSTITAIGNDYGYDATFARQIEALGRKGDVALGISTSGNSKNVIEALRKARALGITAIGLTGGTGGAMKKECGITIVVPSSDTPRIQESHLLAIHAICEIVEEEMAE
jgi:D-sedoheptulose 7-phosphate isomerase